MGLVALAVARQVGHDQAVLPLQPIDESALIPALAAVGVAVHQQDRGATALDAVVEVRALVTCEWHAEPLSLALSPRAGRGMLMGQGLSNIISWRESLLLSSTRSAAFRFFRFFYEYFS